MAEDNTQVKEVDTKDDPTKIEQRVSSKMQFGTLQLTDDLRKEAYSAVIKRFEGVKEQREQRFKQYKDWDNLYKAGEGGAQKETLSEVMTTDGFNAVEDWVALIIDAMFPVEVPFEIKGRKSEVLVEQVQYITKVLSQNMKQTNYEIEFEKVSRQGVELGTFVAKSGWKIDEEPAMRIVEKEKVIKIKNEEGEETEEVMTNEFGEPYVTQEVEEYIEIEDRPSYDFVDLRKLYFRQDKMKWIIELIDTDWAEIERQEGLYDNLKKAKESSYPGTQQDVEEKHITDDSELQEKSLHDLDKDVELMEAHHIPLMLPDSEGEKHKVLCIVSLANRKEVIRVQPTPYKEIPYLFTPFMEKTGVEGMGMMEVLEKMLVEINTRRTQALDANTMGLYGMKAVNMKYIKKPEQLRIRKDGLIEIKETDKPIDQIISFMRPPFEYAQISMDLINRIGNDIIRTTRMKGILAGEKVTPQPSASEWAGMMKEALKSIKVILRRIANGQMEEWLERAYIMNVFNRQKSWIVPAVQQPMQPQLDPMTGQMMPPPEPTWAEVSPQDIYTDGLDIEALGIAYMRDEIIMRHQLLQKLDLLAKYGQLPMVNEEGQQVQPDYYKQMKRIMVSFGSEKPEDEFRVLPPPPMPMMPPAGPQGAMAPPGNIAQQNPPTEQQIMMEAMMPPPGI